MHPFHSKLVKRKPQSVQVRFMGIYFQVYKQALGKFALNFELTDGQANLLLNNWPLDC